MSQKLKLLTSLNNDSNKNFIKMKKIILTFIFILTVGASLNATTSITLRASCFEEADAVASYEGRKWG